MKMTFWLNKEYNKAFSMVKKKQKMNEDQKQTYAKMFNQDQQDHEETKEIDDKDSNQYKNENKEDNTDGECQHKFAKYFINAFAAGVVIFSLYRS